MTSCTCWCRVLYCGGHLAYASTDLRPQPPFETRVIFPFTLFWREITSFSFLVLMLAVIRFRAAFQILSISCFVISGVWTPLPSCHNRLHEKPGGHHALWQPIGILKSKRFEIKTSIASSIMSLRLYSNIACSKTVYTSDWMPLSLLWNHVPNIFSRDCLTMVLTSFATNAFMAEVISQAITSLLSTWGYSWAAVATPADISALLSHNDFSKADISTSSQASFHKSLTPSLERHVMPLWYSSSA